MSDEAYAGEYECSFATSLQGAYYAEAILRARDDGRITDCPWDPSIPVYTYWDLGIADATSIWFAQKAGNQVRFIDYIEDSGHGLGYYINKLARLPYVYALDYAHTAPHDIKVREMGTGVSRWEQAEKLGVRFQVCPNLSIEDGIEASRLLLKTAWFNAKKCELGLKGLENYRRTWSEDKKCFSSKPLHDWSSNPADAFRYAAICIERSTSNNDSDWTKPLPYLDVGIV
jgi:hypothetical protein